MSKRIWKYQLSVAFQQTIFIPKGSRILSAHAQNEMICLWMLLDPDRSDSQTETEIRIFGTGHPIEDESGVDLRFIGTVLIGQFVWHVFEAVKNAEAQDPSLPA